MSIKVVVMVTLQIDQTLKHCLYLEGFYQE